MKNIVTLEKMVLAQKKGRIVERGEDGLAFSIGALRVIASTGGVWDHVSVSVANRLPKYAEMTMIKRLCFKADETAVEYHVPADQHINFHNNCLHLWRPQSIELPRPPIAMV